MSERASVYEMITDRVLDALAKGTVPWRKPWANVPGNGVMFPMSMSTRKPYRGINLFLLGMSGHESAWWGTYNKIAELSGMVKNADGRWESPDGTPRGVRKGEKSTVVTFWKSIPITEVNPDTGKRERKMIPMLHYYNVFNADQADGLPEKFSAITPEATAGTFAEHADAEKILTTYLASANAPTLYYGGNEAFWMLGPDVIHAPERSQYESAAEAYSTLFHECAHSTGHPSRLNRPECIKYDEHNRPKEEMCAEMTSALLLAIAGLTDESAFDNSASYIDGWRRRLSDDPKLVVLAAAQAQHAADYILDIHYSGNDEG